MRSVEAIRNTRAIACRLIADSVAVARIGCAFPIGGEVRSEADTRPEEIARKHNVQHRTRACDSSRFLVSRRDENRNVRVPRRFQRAVNTHRVEFCFNVEQRKRDLNHVVFRRGFDSPSASHAVGILSEIIDLQQSVRQRRW